MRIFSSTLKLVLMGLILVPVSAMGGPIEDGKQAFAARNYDDARQSFAKAFGDGEAEGGYFLARMFELGLGVEVDDLAAVRLYRQTAQSGYAQSLNRLALMHFRGELGVAQDFVQARDYFSLAAKAGDKNAQFNLGKLYFEGKGTDKNLDQALALYRQAAAQDHILALNTLGALYKKGAKSPADKEKARQYFQRSAEFGNAVGLFESGLFQLEQGDDVANRIAAHRLFNLAAARGHPRALEALRELTVVMTSDDLRQAQEEARAFVALSVSEGK